MSPNVVFLFDTDLSAERSLLQNVIGRAGVQQALRTLHDAAQASSTVNDIDPEQMDEAKLMVISIVVEELAQEWNSLSAKFAGVEKRRGVTAVERARLRERLKRL